MKFDAAVLTMLHRLRQNYSVALITNGPSRSQWEKIEQMNAEKLFDSILVSGDLPCEKPEAEIFHLVIKIRIATLLVIAILGRMFGQRFFRSNSMHYNELMHYNKQNVAQSVRYLNDRLR